MLLTTCSTPGLLCGTLLSWALPIGQVPATPEDNELAHMDGGLHQCIVHGLHGEALDKLALTSTCNSYPKLTLLILRTEGNAISV